MAAVDRHSGDVSLLKRSPTFAITCRSKIRSPLGRICRMGGSKRRYVAAYRGRLYEGRRRARLGEIQCLTMPTMPAVELPKNNPIIHGKTNIAKTICLLDDKRNHLTLEPCRLPTSRRPWTSARR